MAKKVLLHMCCAPCSVYPVEVLKQKNVIFEGLFFNPNIHPIEEYDKRKYNVELFSDKKSIKVNYIDDFQEEKWISFTGSDFDRCSMCYATRINKCAQYAAEHNFDCFTTTLLVSPYQNHELIKKLAEEAQKIYSVEFFYEDFRPGFRQAQQKAKDMGLYRQKYCGCIKSLR